MFHIRHFRKVLEEVMRKLEESKTTEERLRQIDWLIGRLFILKVQIAETKWPPKLEE